MKSLKGVLVLSLTSLLYACGGGGSDGYYSSSNTTDNNTDTPTTENTTAAETLSLLKQEGQYLFGNYDPNDPTTSKGYIDHAMDTFSQGPLKLAIDAKKAFDSDRTGFIYREKCMDSGQYANTACYVLYGDNEIKAALNKINANQYENWDFDVNDNEITGMKLSSEQIDHYTGKTMIIIFDNQNADKQFNDVWVTGVFGYPYKQSWGLNQEEQIRIVSMNEADTNYQVTITYADQTSETKGALSIYKDPTSIDGELYVLQNNSGFDVLINDNPNTPEVEPVSFTINSVPGSSNLATYRIKTSGQQILDIPNVTALSGTRIENEIPASNSQNLTGSIYLKGNNIFTFKNALNGEILEFKHIFNGITFEGQSINRNGVIETTLTQPQGLKF
jgi:hypothetical protein